MKNLSRRTSALITIALGVVLFVAINIVSNSWLSSAQLDLTQNGLYTLSSGTRATLAKLQEPVTLRLYFSREQASGYAQVVAYAQRVRDMLKQYASLANGKVRFEEVDPRPFTPAEDDAVAQGMTGAPTQEGDDVYFGLVGTNSVQGHEVIPFFDQSREDYLEYDLTSLVYKLSLPQKPKLGIVSTLPLEAGAGGLQAALSGNSQPYTFYQQLKDIYDVQMLDPATRTTLVRIVTANPKGILKKDLFVDVAIAGPTRHQVLAVPTTAVLYDEQNLPFVYVDTGQGRFEQRTVTIGTQQGTDIEITSGLKADDRVVSQGSLFLQFAATIGK